MSNIRNKCYDCYECKYCRCGGERIGQPLVLETVIVNSQKYFKDGPLFIYHKNPTPLPTAGYIYFLSLNNEIVYIGQTKDPTQRLKSHETNKEFDSYFIIYKRKEYIDEHEAYLIFKFAPKYNKRINCPYKSIKLVAKTTPIKSQNSNLNYCIINNQLYIDLNHQNFDIISSKGI